MMNLSFNELMLNMDTACKEGDLDLLLNSLKSDTYENFRKANGNFFPKFCLDSLCRNENLEMLEYVFKNGYVGNKMEIDGCINIAWQENKLSVLKLILSKEMFGKVYVHVDYLKSYLMNAVKLGRKEVVSLICNHFVENNLLCEEIQLSLVRGAATSGRREIVLSLMELNSGSKKEFKSRYEVALIAACNGEDVYLVNELLRNKNYVSKVEINKIEEKLFKLACNNSSSFYNKVSGIEFDMLEYLIFDYQVKITPSLREFISSNKFPIAEQMLVKKDLEEKISGLVGKFEKDGMKSKI